MTTAPSTPTPIDETEDRRTGWLITFLVGPIVAAPSVAAVGALVLHRDPYPWHAILWVFLTATFVASLAGIVVTTVRPLSSWFGVPNFSDARDERETAVFDRSILLTTIVLMAGLLIASFVTQSVAVFMVMNAGVVTFYISLLYNSRRI